MLTLSQCKLETHLSQRDNVGPVPFPESWPIWGDTARAPLAMVLCTTKGMVASVARLTTEPTVPVAPALPLDPVVPVVARAGMPVMLPGRILDIPLEPVIENEVGMAVRPAELPGLGVIKT